MDRLQLMHIFVRVVETGTFSAVARELKTGQPNISRAISTLEQHLGTRLLHRSTRKLTLTTEGERFAEEARRVLDAVAEAEANARGDDRPMGMLRVGCPSSLGNRVVLPWASEFLKRYEDLRLDLHIEDEFTDLVEGGLDMAIRIGSLRDSAMRARRVGSSLRICVASPTYLERRPAPATPDDLRDHDCIEHSLLTPGAWRLRDGDVPISGRLKVNSTDGVYRAVMNHLGIGYGPSWLFDRAIAEGHLKVVLKDHIGGPVPINIVYSAHRLAPRRVSLFMDFIAEQFERTPALTDRARQRLDEIA